MPPVYAKFQNGPDILVANEGQEVVDSPIGEGVTISVTPHFEGGAAWVELKKGDATSRSVSVPAGGEMNLRAGYTRVQIFHKER